MCSFCSQRCDVAQGEARDLLPVFRRIPAISDRHACCTAALLDGVTPSFAVHPREYKSKITTMKSVRQFRSLVVAGVFAGTISVAISAEGANITAASCARDAVNAAVSAANDGDTVVIPTGSCAWSSGISTSKQITVRAETYTPTPKGATNRSVTITNNSTSPLFSFTTGNSFNVALTGIRFNEGSGTSNHLRVLGEGSRIALISDNYFEVKQRNGNAEDISVIFWKAQGGVLWNNRFVGVGSGPGGSVGPDGASILVKDSPRVWNSSSTMGSRDTTGTVNVYFEDNTFFNDGQLPDIDDHGRVVFPPQ